MSDGVQFLMISVTENCLKFTKVGDFRQNVDFQTQILF